MEEAEYNEKLKKIEEDYESSKKSLYIAYAKSKEIFKVGDIIKDSSKTILIDKITAYKGYTLPEPVYHGKELRKDLMPKKNGDRGSIYGKDSNELVKKSE